MLAEGGFRVHPTRWALAAGVTCSGPVNDALGLLQRMLMGGRLRQTELVAPPIFILGHWRSGTTLLHELLALDARLSSPSTFQCFAPHHFLISEWFFASFGNWLMPSKRPMDNMAAGWSRPQEDEFALMNLGLPSPYRRIAFPRQPPPDMQYLDWQGVSAEDQQRWIAALRSFLVAVTYKTGRPLVLKSPTHTGRIGMLAQAFSGAKFIHITRDPRSLFPSTCRLWRSLDTVQALQKPAEPQVYEDYVVQCLRRMYDGFHRGRQQIPDGSLVEVRYEDLVADPAARLREVYAGLQLGSFEPLVDPLQQWIATQHRGYKTNVHELPAAQESRIRREWADYFERYGYTERQ